LDEVGTAPAALLGFFRYEAKQAKFRWGVERMTHGRLPDNFDPVQRRALAAKQIDSKLIANCRSLALQSREWNAHGSVPNLGDRIDASGYREAGVPGPAIFVMRLGQVNIKIDPFPSLYLRMF
jgi:hypothetical protein